MKTAELKGAALNWAVAQAEGDKVFRPRLGRPGNWDKEAYLKDGSDDRWVVRVENPKEARFVDWTYNPSGDWMQGGPLIEREHIEWQWLPSSSKDHRYGARKPSLGGAKRTFCMDGPTVLIAAMRCYVASKLGDEVEIPEELK